MARSILAATGTATITEPTAESAAVVPLLAPDSRTLHL